MTDEEKMKAGQAMLNGIQKAMQEEILKYGVGTYRGTEFQDLLFVSLGAVVAAYARTTVSMPHDVFIRRMSDFYESTSRSVH